MMIPPRMKAHKENQVCKLNKSLYGLKQSSKQQFTKLASSLQGIGFIQTSANHSLFIIGNRSKFTTLFVYVDDIILAENYSHEIQEVTTYLDQTFKVKDLGDLKHILGLEVDRSHKGFIYVRKNMLLTFFLKSVCLLLNQPLLQ